MWLLGSRRICRSRWPDQNADGAGLKRLALTLVMGPDDWHEAVTSAEDHRHILRFGIPRLLAACPTLRLHLRINGRNVFEPRCSFQHAQQVPAASSLRH